MTNKSELKQPGSNHWSQGGQAKTSTVNAAFGDFLKSVDWGSNTADAVRQPDGSWEVYGQGSAGLVSSMAVSAELKVRKIGFLPRQVERKIARSARFALVSAGQFTLCDGTVIRRTNGQGKVC